MKEGPFGFPTGERGDSGIKESVLTGTIRVGAVVFNPGVALSTVQAAIDRALERKSP